MENGDSNTGNTSQPNSNLNPANTPEKQNFWKSAREWAQVILIALIISMPIRLFIAEPFVVNGASMDPTFSTGQFLIVDRLTYRFEQPSRGDVIVFEYPNDPNIYYIKRIIGLPGETLDIRSGKITITPASTTPGHIDGRPFQLDEPYVEPVHASTDTLHEVLGPTEYFVMGDNRAQSSDSRAWGPLDAHYIVGRPVVRLLPINAISVLPGEFTQPTATSTATLTATSHNY